MSVALQSSDPPAEAAAKVLIRLGPGLLYRRLPCTGIFWRGAIYVLLPVGATLILIGAMLMRPAYRPEAARRACLARFLAAWPVSDFSGPVCPCFGLLPGGSSRPVF